ncbi:invasion associated locus B family protein [Falsiroseomonas selenitidurans]|uniref:Invasion associated locus B family protein n=1 Tax=Falsiroseomonas selenitidurans TaxID=2716335 RepID=A0ABX1E9Z8_9PROT|nr:invasion associated locus B family protein [Falsiroseomonas selenitidurans]NKC32332.1 hypothetical protein [Falsiroseomonas selenitidurans]
MVRIALPLLAALVLPFAAEAQPRAQPQRLGAHQSWTAATHQEGGQKICYAFARSGDGENAARRNVMLTVTHRPAGRDQVAVSVGQALPRGAEAVMTVTSSGGNNDFRSYGVVGASAFFQGGTTLIDAFRAGRDAMVRTPGAGGRPVTDTFSLIGFTAAYEAISRECPARR